MCAPGRGAAAFAQITENAGLAIARAATIATEPPPAADELALVRSFDPRRAILG